MKKDQEIPVLEISEEQKKSMERTRKLAENVFKAIKETADEIDEDFTTFELVDVFSRLAHRYNSEGLRQQYKNESK